MIANTRGLARAKSAKHEEHQRRYRVERVYLVVELAPESERPSHPDGVHKYASGVYTIDADESGSTCDALPSSRRTG